MTPTFTGPRTFLQGPAGCGKTTLAIAHLGELLEFGAPADSILVLVPQRTLGQPYQQAMHGLLRHVPGDITVVTLAGIARRNLERFWPLIAADAGFDPALEPLFLTIETAQYYMMRFVRPAVREGIFDAIALSPTRIAAQLLDNMAKAAIAGFPFSEVAERLMTAWGDRASNRLQVYRTSQQISEDYRAYCQAHGLLDYALQLEVFARHLLPHLHFRRAFTNQYLHLIADNIEEAGPLAHDFIRDLWPAWESALLVYDADGGYRTFLGADPESAEGLRELCDEVVPVETTTVSTPEVLALEFDVQRSLNPVFKAETQPAASPLPALDFPSADELHVYYPQMLDWVTGEIAALVADGLPPGEIVVLTPFLTDSLRFALQSRLDRLGIPSVSHRPSRALRDEPAARALVTLLLLAHPTWEFQPPPRSDVADMFTQAIDGLDPVRARLLADIVYKPQYGGVLGEFERIQPPVRERITYVAGERYERLRLWLSVAIEETTQHPGPLDHFLQRLFGEVLSQPGFGFHSNLDAGRIAAEIIESARKFRQVLYPFTEGQPDWNAVGHEYLSLVNEGVLAALYTRSWQADRQDAVFLSPAFTYLMRNRPVDYQFWLDIGSNSWWERLDQPLTHPYVLTRYYPANRVWTDRDESERQREILFRIAVGLLRRCRKGIYLGISDLNEQGYEQRGPLLYVFQQILQRHGEGSADAG